MRWMFQPQLSLFHVLGIVALSPLVKQSAWWLLLILPFCFLSNWLHRITSQDAAP